MAMKSKAMIAAAFEHLPVPAMIVGADGCVITLNAEAKRLTGHTSPILSSHAENVTCRDLCHCQIPEDQCPRIRAMRDNRPVRRAEVSMHLPRGRRVVNERVTPFMNPKTGESYSVITLTDATLTVRRLRSLRRHAHRDMLTRVLNRNYFEAIFSRITHKDRRRSPSAFLMLDVDGLKHVNDTMGHDAGDELLRRLGMLLRMTVRHSDLLGRLGGDEFGVYCPDTTAKEAQELRVRILNAIEQSNRDSSGVPPLHVGIGMGVSYPHLTAIDMRKQADTQLCNYKRSRSHRS